MHRPGGLGFRVFRVITGFQFESCWRIDGWHHGSTSSSTSSSSVIRVMLAVML